MVYDYVPVKTFAEKCWREGRSVPVPDNPPAYGTLTDYTEPILQRRMMIVTDDYVVLADYVKGTQPHTYESLLQLKGLLGVDGAQKEFIRHVVQWNANPVSSAQFVTDCNWYRMHAPAITRSEQRFGPGEDQAGNKTIGNESGVLKVDVHTLWPATQQMMVGTAPEPHDVEKRLYYTVRGDGKTLAEGKFGAWILGQGNVDVPLEGVKRLELETKTELSKKPTLFWAGARVTRRDGKEMPLSQLPMKFDNITRPKVTDQDYAGGPVKIAGNIYHDNVPAEPADAKQPGVVTVDLSGIDAVRLKAVIGSDYPPGDEGQRRRVFAVRAERAPVARFLTVIEPYEDKPIVTAASAPGADDVHVELSDGRVQDIRLEHFDGDGTDLAATLTETRQGRVVRQERATVGTPQR
jgi:hypothetical protein